MKHLKLFEQESESTENIKDIIEDYLLELTDLGWEIDKIMETHITDKWEHKPYQVTVDLPINGFWITLNPPVGLNPLREEDPSLSKLTTHFVMWSEWLKTIPSVLRKLTVHVGEVNCYSNFGDDNQWGAKWLCILVKREKI